jgi:hypothetical protein
LTSPRSTRLVRVSNIQAFRDAVATLACDGAPLEARDRIVVVPTRAAAAHLTRTIEDRLLGPHGAVMLPDLTTPRDLVFRFGERLDTPRRLLAPAEREVLLGVACREAQRAGAEPPFRLRPALIAEILFFYDALRRRQNSVDDFERRALSQLEPARPTIAAPSGSSGRRVFWRPRSASSSADRRHRGWTSISSFSRSSPRPRRVRIDTPCSQSWMRPFDPARPVSG